MTQKRNARLTRQQIVNIGSTLEQCLKKSDKEGFFEYQDGWSDQRIGSANGATDTHVASLRKELFGELKRQYNGVNPLATAWERIKDLERRVTDLEDAMTTAGKADRQNELRYYNLTQKT